MAQLKIETEKLMNSFQESKTGVSFVSFLVLEYHTSSDNRIKGGDTLSDFYGLIHEQLVEVYSELEFSGYITTDKGTIEVTKKATALLDKQVKRKNPVEITRLKDGFESYWTTLTHKIGKKKAYLVWMKLAPNKELVEHIVKSVISQLAYKKRMDGLGKFVPELQHPERWLANERWEDVVEEVSVVKKQTRPTRDER